MDGLFPIIMSGGAGNGRPSTSPTAKYLRELNSISRTPFWLVEVDIDECQNEYAVNNGVDSFCQAPAAVDGQRCWFAYCHCKDRPNYRKGTRTLWFSSKDKKLPPLIEAKLINYCFPTVLDVSAISQEIDPEAAFTRTEQCTVKFFDLGGTNDMPDMFPHKSTANTTINTQGSFWARFLAMNPNWRDRKIRVARGFITDDFTIEDCLYIWQGRMEQITRDTKGQVAIRSRDLFERVDVDLPFEISSDNVTTADISRIATSVPIVDADEVTDPTTVTKSSVVIQLGEDQDSEDNPIGPEYIIVTAIPNDTTLTVTRGAFGSFARHWNKGTPIKEVLYFKDELPLDIVLALLERAEILDEEINLDAFAREAQWIGPARLTRIVNEATAVRELIYDVGELFQCDFFIDEESLVSCKVNRPRDQDEEEYSIADEPNVVFNTGEGNYNELSRLGTVYVFADPLPGDDEDYALRVRGFNAETLVDNFYDNGSRKFIKSRWIRKGDTSLAILTTVRWLLRYAEAPPRFKFHAELRDAPLHVGKVVNLTVSDFQDPLGNPLEILARVIKREPDEDHGFTFTLQGTGINPDKRYCFFSDAVTIPDVYKDQADPLASNYGYFAGPTGNPDPNQWGLTNDDGGFDPPHCFY